MELIRSPIAAKKWRAIFRDGTYTDFGASGYKDYTQHHDGLRRASYLARHRTNENWNDPKTAGALSRWLLWNTTSLENNLRLYRRRFFPV